MIKLHAIALTSILMLSPPAAAALGETSDGTASTFVEVLGSQAVDVLRTDDIPASEQERRIQEILRRSLDLEAIGRYVVGHHWDSATREQRRTYLDLFGAYLLNTCSALLRRGDVSRFAVEQVSTTAGHDALVHSKIDTAGGDRLALDWQLRGSAGQFRVVDLIADGISLAQTLRGEVGSLIKNSGWDALFRVLRTRI